MNPPAPAPALESEHPSFDELTLVKLCEWNIRGHCGSTEEQVQALIEDPVFEMPLTEGQLIELFDEPVINRTLAQERIRAEAGHPAPTPTHVHIPPEHQVDALARAVRRLSARRRLLPLQGRT